MPRADANFNIGAKNLTKQTFKEINASLTKTRSSVLSNTSAIKGLVAGYVGLRTVRLGLDISNQFIEAADATEMYRIQLEQLLGSQEKANQVFENTAEFAANVSFTYQEAMDAASRFSGIVSDPSAIQQMIEITGDLAAVGRVTFDQAAQQMVRMWSAGAGSADLFRERGITAMLGFESGVSVSAEDTRKKVIEEFEKIDSKFRGTSKRLADTWSGLMSMYSDRWFQFRNELAAAGVFDFIKVAADEVLNDLTESLKDNRKNFKSWSDFIIMSSIDMAQGIGSVADAFSELNKFIQLSSLGFDQLLIKSDQFLTLEEKRARNIAQVQIKALEEELAHYRSMQQEAIALNAVEEVHQKNLKEIVRINNEILELKKLTDKEQNALLETERETNRVLLSGKPSDAINELIDRIKNRHAVEQQINEELKLQVALGKILTESFQENVKVAKERNSTADDLINKFKIDLGLRKQLTEEEKTLSLFSQKKYEGITEGQKQELIKLAQMKDEAVELMKVLQQPVLADATFAGFDPSTLEAPEGNAVIEQALLEEQARKESLDRIRAHEGEFLDWRETTHQEQLESFMAFNDILANHDEMTHQRKLQAAIGFAGSLATVMSGSSKKAFEVQQQLAIGSAVVDGYKAAVSAWSAGMATGGPWAPLVAAAYTGTSLLKTGALIKSIKSQKFGGGGDTGGSAGGASLPSVSGSTGSAIPTTSQLPAQDQQIGPTDITVNLPNQPWQRTEVIGEVLEDLFSQLPNDYRLQVNTGAA